MHLFWNYNSKLMLWHNKSTSISVLEESAPSPKGQSKEGLYGHAYHQEIHQTKTWYLVRSTNIPRKKQKGAGHILRWPTKFAITAFASECHVSDLLHLTHHVKKGMMDVRRHSTRSNRYLTKPPWYGHSQASLLFTRIIPHYSHQTQR